MGNDISSLVTGSAAPVEQNPTDQVIGAEQEYLKEAALLYGKYGLGAPLAAIPMRTLGHAVNSAGWKLLQEMDKKHKQSAQQVDMTIVSPVVLASMLAAVSAGAMHGSQGVEEISEIFQLPMACTECLEEVGKLTREVASNVGPRTVMWMPMCIWLPTHINLEFCKFATESLGVDVKRFKDTLGINFWIEDRTDQKLYNIVPDGIKPRGCQVTSGLYFHGVWAVGFNPDDNQRDVFNVPLALNRQKGNKQVPCIMMRRRDTLAYVEVWTGSTAGSNTVCDPELAMLAPQGFLCQILELPYGESFATGGGSYSAVFILPAPSLPISQLVTVLGLSPHRWRHWMAGMKARKIDVKLPKCTITNSNTPMLEDIHNLGLQEVFYNNEEGVLLGMTEDPLMHIDGFFHQVKIDFKEDGMMVPPQYDQDEDRMQTSFMRMLPVKFHIDRPFLFAIQDKQSGALVAISKVEYPKFAEA